MVSRDGHWIVASAADANRWYAVCSPSLVFFMDRGDCVEGPICCEECIVYYDAPPTPPSRRATRTSS